MTVIDMTFVLNAGHQNSNLFVYNSSDTTTLMKMRCRIGAVGRP